MSRGLRKDRWRFAEGHSAVLDEAQELEIRITAIEKMKMTSENDILDTNHRLAPRHFSEEHISLENGFTRTRVSAQPRLKKVSAFSQTPGQPYRPKNSAVARSPY